MSLSSSCSSQCWGCECGECDECKTCEGCLLVCDDAQVHSWGCVRLCRKCATEEDGSYQCKEGYVDTCDVCDGWREEDAEEKEKQ
jgi:hypothetical protein